MKTRTLLLPLLLAVSTTPSHAANVTVKMLTKGPEGSQYVFDPMYVKVKVGDTVTFQPVDKNGHTSVSVLVPGGAPAWRAAPNAEIKVKIEKEGVYLVECDVHKVMGMVAVLQAGKAVNLADAKTKAAQESSHMAMNKDRFGKLLAMVK